MKTVNIPITEITTTLISMLVVWQGFTEQRTVNISMPRTGLSSGEQVMQIWVYDAETYCGAYITSISDLEQYIDMSSSWNKELNLKRYINENEETKS